MRRAVPGWVLLVLLSTGLEGVRAGDADTLERITSPVIVDSSGAAPDLAQALSRRKIKHWKPIIDATWGPGAPTSEKLSVFDAAWEDLDTGYGAFVNLDVAPPSASSDRWSRGSGARKPLSPQRNPS